MNMTTKVVGYLFRLWFKSTATGQPAYISYATALGIADSKHPDEPDLLCVEGLQVNDIDENGATVLLPNFDNTLSAIALNNRLQGSDCEISAIEISDTAQSESVIFKGKIDEVPSIDNHLELRAGAYIGLAHAPNVYISAPLFNHLTPADVLVQFGDINYKVQPKRGA